MDSIELMVDEHKNVKRMLVVIRKICYRVLKNEEVDYHDFFKIVDFIRNYTDNHHHGKEEHILFEMMVSELGKIAEKLITHGMLIEHDLGRLYNQELEAAVKRVLDGDEESKLDVIANAISYTHLLHRHIDKEDNVVYKYARNNLSSEALKRLEQECRAFEEKAANNKVQAQYLEILKMLEEKYSTI